MAYSLTDAFSDIGSIAETYGPELAADAAPYLQTGANLLLRATNGDASVAPQALSEIQQLISRAAAGDQEAIFQVGAIDAAYRSSAASQNAPVSGYLVTAGGRVLTGQFVQVR